MDYVVGPALGLALIFAVMASVRYGQFRRAPVRAWRDRVLTHVGDLRRQRDLLQREEAASQWSISRLRGEAWQRYLQSRPVSLLQAHSGIGPATVGKLEEAGLRSLADIAAFRFERLPGIGEVRAKDLMRARDAEIKEARSRFDAGACPEAQEFRRQLAAADATERERALARDAELSALNRAVDAALPYETLARQVTFLRFFFNAIPRELSDALMRQPLPVPQLEPRNPAPPPPARPRPPEVRLPPQPPVAAQVPEAIPAPPSRPMPPKPSAPQPKAPTDLFREELKKQPAAPAPIPAEPALLPRLRAAAGFALMIAKADGRVAQGERRVIRAILEDQFGHDAALLRHLDPLLERFSTAPPDEVAAVTALKAAFPQAEWPAWYRLAERIADAMGERNDKEQAVLDRIAAALGLAVAPPTAPVSPSPPSQPTAAEPLEDPRIILEIEPDIPLSVDLIRRRYVNLSEKLDPTRVAAMGPEFVRMAEDKRRRVRWAAETLIKPFGEPLDPPAAPAPPTDLRHNPDLDDVFGD